MASHCGGSATPLHTAVVVVAMVVLAVDVVSWQVSQRTGHALMTYEPTDGLVQILVMPRKTSQLGGSATPLHVGVVVVVDNVDVEVVEVVMVVVSVTVVFVAVDVEVVQTPQRTGQCCFKISPVMSTLHRIGSTPQSGQGSAAPLHFSGPMVVVVVEVVAVVAVLVEVVWMQVEHMSWQVACTCAPTPGRLHASSPRKLHASGSATPLQ